jgi:hypothetical protein
MHKFISSLCFHSNVILFKELKRVCLKQIEFLTHFTFCHRKRENVRMFEKAQIKMCQKNSSKRKSIIKKAHNHRNIQKQKKVVSMSKKTIFLLNMVKRHICVQVFFICQKTGKMLDFIAIFSIIKFFFIVVFTYAL